MTEQQENIVYDYIDQFPDSLTRRQIDFDNDELIVRIAPLMAQALSDGKPLTDAIFNLPNGVNY